MNLCIKLLLRPLLLTSLWGPSALAQTPPPPNDQSGNQSNNQALTWPAHFHNLKERGLDRTGYTILGIGTLTTLATLPYDKDVYDHMHTKNRKFDSGLAQVGSRIGGGVPFGLVAIGQLIYDRENGFAHAEALVLASLTHNLIKFPVARRRPDRPQKESFPSGHVAHAFAAATSLGYAYGWKVGAPMTMAATLVAASRLNDGVHWTSDVVAAAAIGIFWGRATRWDHNSNIEPYLDIEGRTMGFRYKF